MKPRKRCGNAIKYLLGQNIRLYRETICISQEELAEKAGISPPFLGSIERGEKWPSPETLTGIAIGLKVEPYDLFKPEHIISSDVNRLTKKLVRDIQTSVNQTVRAINLSIQVNNKQEKQQNIDK
ncbi:MAG: helix-turn-helix domain-containing protein [Treponema sp.]|jgi:transcriptional regulator with XRE-family HTH domain|nr:helix-turn-helix domain-containing protein [Treponema sp.]